MKALKVLIAEDDGLTLRLLQDALRGFGHELVSVRDGAAAWDAFMKHVLPEREEAQRKREKRDAG